jgi:hypothetical protein
MIGCGAHFQVPGLSHQEPGTGAQVQVRVQEICPLSSGIDSVIDSFQVAGGGPRWQVAGFSIQPSMQCSTQPSIQTSTQPSMQSSIQSSIQPSILPLIPLPP